MTYSKSTKYRKINIDNLFYCILALLVPRLLAWGSSPDYNFKSSLVDISMLVEISLMSQYWRLTLGTYSYIQSYLYIFY